MYLLRVRLRITKNRTLTILSTGCISPSKLYVDIMDMPDQDPELSYTIVDWVMVLYKNIKVLSGVIVDHDKTEDKYCVRSMVDNSNEVELYIWPCNYNPPSSSLSRCNNETCKNE